MHKAPKVRHSLAPSVPEARGFRRKAALRDKGGVKPFKKTVPYCRGQEGSVSEATKRFSSESANSTLAH
jgi:hypothetical protein